MCKVINFEERRAKLEEKNLGKKTRGCTKPIIVELDDVEQELDIFIDLFRQFVTKAEEEGEELTSEKIDKFMEEYEMIEDLMEEVAEDKPNTADEIANHFVENGDARDLVIKVEKESYTSVIVIKYEEIEKKLLDAYGRLWLHDMYMRKDHEEQFRVLMELCRIRDIEYEDLSDDEKTSFSYIIIHLRNDLC